ncbi:hypothetical protein ITP53_47110 [Nonomuraea sp. K274]|uniref:Uncharacterized protein n=1 Tax=Nonomuraea cypriaca TaxID=1187855 RepID=A0A931F4Y2_9ACTN|nr:hypothetical protein [Nonomuraea cypriaca]MBF8193117.1 hypothetical protein [Nonomuraea cypriaca]
MIYDNPQAFVLCHYKRAQALCHRDGVKDTPSLDHCVPGCGNIVCTDGTPPACATAPKCWTNGPRTLLSRSATGCAPAPAGCARRPTLVTAPGSPAGDPEQPAQEPIMTPLERTLAKALTEVVIRLDLSDDDAITPEATMQVIEPVAVLLQDLSEQDRQALADLINQFAHQETDPERQLTTWERPKLWVSWSDGRCGGC